MKKENTRSRRTFSPASRALARCAAGALFLLNPNFDVFDIIPDAIGFLLIVSGLRLLEPVSPSVEEARKRFSMLLRISLIRIAILPVRMSVGYNEKTFILIFTLAFAILETMYLLPAFHYLFDGTSYLAMRHGGASSKIKQPRIISAVFAVGRAVLNVVPELKYLPSELYDENVGLVVTYERIKLSQLSNMLLLVNVIFTLILSIIWAARFRGYIKRLRKDSALDESLSAELAEQTRDEGLALLAKLKPAFTLISIAMFASLDFYADGYNLIPDVISALLLLAASLYIYSAKECGRSLPITAGLYSALAAGLAVYNYIYAEKHYAYAMLKRPEALQAQSLQTVYSVVCAVIFAVLMFVLCRTLVGVTSRHAGLFAEAEFHNKNLRTQRQRLRVRNMLWLCFVLAVATDMTQTIYGALLITKPTLWIPAAILTVVLGALTSWTTGDLYYQIELRHGKTF